MNSALSETWQHALTDTDLNESGKHVLAGSDFVKQWGERYPQQLALLIESGALHQVFQPEQYQQQLTCILQDVNDENALKQQLRLFRHRQMVRIIWRDLAGWADLAETVRDLSALADACIENSLALLHQWQCQQLGTPCNADGEEQQLIVIAMGKLGAGELNLSSDIDLIFAYPEPGETKGGRKTLSNGEFFIRLGQKLIQALDQVTVDGFVFRVDMRLRPFGDSGALVSSFDAMEDYYQTQGREWERYAMIKSRPVTGSKQALTNLYDLLLPFVYRRYLDYGVFESLREMKSMIVKQLHRRGMDENIKLGAGGIREIEFIGQVFQLIHGGKDKALQQRPILLILDLLAERNLLDKDAVEQLKTAYDFLRKTEHRLQAWADKQTHVLPDDDEGQQRLATLMGFADYQQFLTQLQHHRDCVQAHFNELLAVSNEHQPEDSSIDLCDMTSQQSIDYFEQLGFALPQQCADLLQNLLNSHSCQNLEGLAKERFQKLLPLVMQAAAATSKTDDCVARLFPFLAAIMRRTAYMSLLIENPGALTQLVRLFAASDWISNELTAQPMLLDELLDARNLYDVPDRARQHQQLVRLVQTEQKGDLERQMDLLREFKRSAVLHIAAADITDALPLMRVGDQLSQLAEIQIEQVIKFAWQYMTKRHGYPPCTDSDDLHQCGLAVLAYGKLGGLELGYGSDLDIVFIYDEQANQGMTNGEKAIDAQLFYTRLCQRIIHMMNTRTARGILYEIDMRLRPNGQSGLLVTSLSGFEGYQSNDAWVWEHQALVRARCVAGDHALIEKVNRIRQQVLASARDEIDLEQEVRQMRAKMRQQLDKSKQQLFDLKQGAGGITDIEFLVQYAVLKWSQTLPELRIYSDNIRILQALAQTAKLTQQQSDALADAYRYYRDRANQCVLQGLPALIDVSEVAQHREQVQHIWQCWLGE